MLRKSAFLLSLLLLSCQSPIPQQGQLGQSGAQPARFQSFGNKRTARDPMPQIQQFHAPLLTRNPELVKLKYQAMSESPFIFYRATAFLFYSDIKAETALVRAVSGAGKAVLLVAGEAVVSVPWRSAIRETGPSFTAEGVELQAASSGSSRKRRVVRMVVAR